MHHDIFLRGNCVVTLTFNCNCDFPPTGMIFLNASPVCFHAGHKWRRLEKSADRRQAIVCMGRCIIPCGRLMPTYETIPCGWVNTIAWDNASSCAGVLIRPHAMMRAYIQLSSTVAHLFRRFLSPKLKKIMGIRFSTSNL